MMNLQEKKIVYKAAAEEFLRRKFSIDRLEERFAEAGFTPMEDDDSGSGHARFIYLFNEPDLERLSEEDMALFDKIGTGDDGQALEAFSLMVARTYPEVLCPGKEANRMAEFFPDTYDRGVLPENSIILLFRDRISADRIEDEDVEFERRKDRIFVNVKRQFEALASKEKAYCTWLIRL